MTLLAAELSRPSETELAREGAASLGILRSLTLIGNM